MSAVNTIRIAGVNLPPNKHIWVALTGLYGIGKTSALKICEACGIEPSMKVSSLTPALEEVIRKYLTNYTVEGDLRRKIAMSIKRIIDLKCYRGLRHIRKLPSRGQRTKTNARTCKGKKRMPNAKKG